jgi:hypothetical protein
VSRLQVFVDEAALMDLADGEREELRCLHRSADMPVERHATGIFENQQRLTAIANEFQRPGGPRTLQMILQSVFMRETIDAGRPRAFRGQPQRQHTIRRPVFACPPSPIERALAVLP